MPKQNYNLKIPSLTTDEIRSKVTTNNITMIETYLRRMKMMKAKSKKRQAKLKWMTFRLAYWLGKDFDKATKDDIEKLVSNIDDMPLKPNTKRDYRICIKNFYKVMIGDNIEYPHIVKWITFDVEGANEIDTSVILNEDHVNMMIDAANNSRDRAFIMSLFESGCRGNELRELCWKDIEFKPNGITLLHIESDVEKGKTVKNKTSKRSVPLLASTPFLARWKQEHSKIYNKESPVWICLDKTKPNYGEMVTYERFCKILYNAALKAKKVYGDAFDIDPKDVHPHALRHSRATDCAKKGWDRWRMCKLFGWSLSSRMPDVYISKEGIDAEEQVLVDNGMPKAKKQESKLSPKKCYRCYAQNPYNAHFCSTCAAVLDVEVATHIDKAREAEKLIIGEDASDIAERLHKLEERLAHVALSKRG